MTWLDYLFSPGTIERLGWMLVHVLWQATIIAVVLAAFLRLVRRSDARIRYGGACAALTLMVVLPLVTLRFIQVPGPVAEAGPPPAAVVLPPEEVPTADGERYGATEYWSDGRVGKQSTNALTFQDSSVPSLHSSPVPLRERIVSALEPALPYVVLGWLVGVFGLSAWHLGGWTQLQRLRRRMVREIGDPLQQRLEQLAVRLGVPRTVGLLESALVEVPTVVGWLRPVILLPASALTGLRPEQLEAILAHELAHIRRYDYLVNILQTVVEILGFYHPAVWWVSHRIRIERENCCDDLAVQVCGNSLQYARALACMEEIRHSAGDLAVAATGGSLMARIARLLGRPVVEDRRFAWLPGLIALLLVVGIILPAALVLGVPRAPQAGEPVVASIAGAVPGTAEPNAAPGATEGSSPSTNGQGAEVLLEFRIAQITDDLRPNRALLQQMAQALGDQSPLARRLRESGQEPDITLGEVFKRYVVAQPLSEPAFQAMIRLLQAQSGVEMLSAPRVLTRDGVQAEIRLMAGERFLPASDPSGELQKIEYGTMVRTTPQVLDSRRVALKLMTEISDLVHRSDVNEPTIARMSAEANVIAANDQYLIWAAIESPTTASGTKTNPQSVYVMVKPHIDRLPAQGLDGAAAGQESAGRSSRQVRLDVRTATMERSALGALGIQWNRTQAKAGMVPPAAGESEFQGVRTGYTVDQAFTDSLLAILDLLQKTQRADIASQHVLVQDGKPSQVKSIKEEWFTYPAPPGKDATVSGSVVQKIDIGTSLSITPHISPTNDLRLDVDLDVGRKLPNQPGNTLPMLSRRTVRSTVTIRDGGTVALAGLVENPGGPKDKSGREVVTFVTAHLVNDAEETIPPASAADAAPSSIAFGIESAEVSTVPVEVRSVSSPEETQRARQSDRSAESDLEESVKAGDTAPPGITASFTNADVLAVLAKIAERAGVKITHDATVKTTPVSAELVQAASETALQQVLKGTPYIFRKEKDGSYLVFRPLSKRFANTELVTALQDIAAAAGVTIIPDLNVTGPVHASFEDVSLDEALELLLAGKPYLFKRVPEQNPRYYLVADASLAETPFPETRRIRLNYVQPARVKMLLHPIFVRHVEIEQPNPLDPNNRGNVVLVTGASALVDRIVADIRQIDRAQRQVLLEARVVVMERADLRNLGVEWSWPKIQAGAFTDRALDPNTGSVSRGWPYGVQIGYSPDRAFTDSLMMALNLLQENRKADIIANPKVVALDGRRAEMRVIQEEWFMMMTTPDPNSFVIPPQLSKIESGTVLAITPYIGDNNDITLQMAVEVSDSMPNARGSDLPVVTRRMARNSVTVKDGGTVAVGGLTQTGAKQKDKPGRDVAVFVTAHLLPESPQSAGTQTKQFETRLAERLGKATKRDHSGAAEVNAPEERGSSRAWHVMRQWNCPPLLLGLTPQLAKMLEPSRRNDPGWQDVSGGGALRLKLDVEGDLPGEVMVGLFKDAQWSAPPVAVRRLGAGTHVLTGLPAGRYQIGAMLGSAPVPVALGVHRTWPGPVEIKVGQTASAEVLVAEAFQKWASGWYNREVAKDYIGQWDDLDEDNLLQGQLTGPDGKPIPFGLVEIREHHPGARSIATADQGTNEPGVFKFDGMNWPYQITAVWREGLPSVLGQRRQRMYLSRVLAGTQRENFRFAPFPEGTAQVVGRVIDQNDKPVQGFFLRVHMPPFSDLDLSRVTDGYKTQVSYDVPFVSEDGRFELGGLPAGRATVEIIPFEVPRYQRERGQDVVLEAGQTTQAEVKLVGKGVFYGRVLFEDGTPAVIRPTPWRGAVTRIMMTIGPRAGGVGEVGPDGYFTLYVGDTDKEALSQGNSRLLINVPTDQENRWDRVGEFPYEKLSEDKGKAGTVTVKRPGPTPTLPAKLLRGGPLPSGWRLEYYEETRPDRRRMTQVLLETRLAGSEEEQFELELYGPDGKKVRTLGPRSTSIIDKAERYTLIGVLKGERGPDDWPITHGPFILDLSRPGRYTLTGGLSTPLAPALQSQ